MTSINIDDKGKNRCNSCKKLVDFDEWSAGKAAEGARSSGT